MSVQLVVLDHEAQPRDEGSIWQFAGQVLGGARDGLHVRVAVDWRNAHAIADALATWSEGEEVMVYAEDWQVA